MTVNRVKAVNHLGWEVQEKDPEFPDKGWYPAIEVLKGYEEDGDTPIYEPMKPFHSYEGAEAFMEEHARFPYLKKGLERRVYEVVSEPKK